MQFVKIPLQDGLALSKAIQNRLALANSIREAKAPKEIAGIINKHGLPIIGVHPFYRETAPAKIMNNRQVTDYAAYRENVLELMLSLSSGSLERTVLLIESEAAISITSNILSEKGIQTSKISWFFSISGEIRDPSKKLPKQEKYTIAKEANKANQKLGTYLAISELIKSGMVFAFGLFSDHGYSCACGEITNLANSSKVYGFELAGNDKLFTLSLHS